MTRTELLCINIGRFSTSVAWYGDGAWRFALARLGPWRWRIDISRLGWRLEWY